MKTLFGLVLKAKMAILSTGRELQWDSNIKAVLFAHTTDRLYIEQLPAVYYGIFMKTPAFLPQFKLVSELTTQCVTFNVNKWI